MGIRIREVRTSKGLSQPDLARISGVSQQMISKMELGGVRHSSFIYQLAEALHIPPQELDPEIPNFAVSERIHSIVCSVPENRRARFTDLVAALAAEVTAGNGKVGELLPERPRKRSK